MTFHPNTYALKQTEMSLSTDKAAGPSSNVPEEYFSDLLGYISGHLDSQRLEDQGNLIKNLEETVERYRLHGEYSEIVRDPLSFKAKDKIDPKWVQGLDIPLPPEHRRPSRTMAIVFDPSSTEFAAINENFINRES